MVYGLGYMPIYLKPNPNPNPDPNPGPNPNNDFLFQILGDVASSQQAPNVIPPNLDSNIIVLAFYPVIFSIIEM